MPYRRRSYRKKSPLKRLIKPRKTTAIQTLAKQIQGIKRSMKQERKIVNFQQSGANPGTAIANEVQVINPSILTSWNSVFGSSADDQEAPSAVWKSTGMDLLFKSYNEATEVNFTVFLVRCKDVMAPYLNLTTGAVTLTLGVHYANSATGSQTAAGLVMVNKKFFDILAIKRFTLGNNGTTLSQPSAQTQFGTDRRIYMKFAPNAKISNPNGNWAQTGCPQDPSQNYLLLIFNNNDAADAENPRVFWNFVHTVVV